MRLFLTGGTGFIGQSLTKALLARGWRVTALVRRPDSAQAQALYKMGVELATGDVTDRDSMRAAMRDAEMVIHNAGHYEYGVDRRGRQRMHAVNVTGTDNVLGLAQELHIARTIYISTVVAFGESGQQPRDESFVRQAPCRTTYEQTKTEAHTIARQYQQRGLPLIIACPNSVIGANDHSPWGYFLRLYLNRLLPPVAWSPHTIHTAVYVADLAEGIALLAEHGRIGECYFLCGEAQTFREHLTHWRKRPGAYNPLLWLPANVAAWSWAPLEPLQRLVGLPAFLSRETVVSSSTNWQYVSDKMQRELGWRPRSAEAMWLAAIDGELQLLARRKGQSLRQRIQPLATVE